MRTIFYCVLFFSLVLPISCCHKEDITPPAQNTETVPEDEPEEEIPNEETPQDTIPDREEVQRINVTSERKIGMRRKYHVILVVSLHSLLPITSFFFSIIAFISIISFSPINSAHSIKKRTPQKPLKSNFPEFL